MHPTQRSKSLFAQIKKLLSTETSRSQPFDAIPGPKPLPLIGNVWRYLPLIGNYKPDTLFENAQYNKKRYGPIVREKLTSNLTIVHLFDPKDIETFFRQDGKYPYRRSHRALLKYRLDQPELYQDGGLFPENGPNWYRQRNQFQQRLMSKSQVFSNAQKLDKMSLKTIEWIDNFSKGQDLIKIEEFETILYRWALGNSLSLFLDFDIDNLEDKFVDEFIKQLHSTLLATDKTEIQTEKWKKYPEKCPYYQILVKSQEFLYKFVNKQLNCLSKAQSSHTQNISYCRDWLHNDKVDRRDVISFVIDAFMAGLHTTSYTIAFLLYHIANNKVIQKSLRLEIENHLPLQGSITVNHIDKFALLRDCLKETMRLNPVSIGTGRLTSQDDLLIRNHKIPKDTMIITQTQTISRDEEIYTEPDLFKPERWTAYRAYPRHQRPSPFATLPFGFGARSCIGQRLAELQIKIMAARLLQRFEITFDDKIPTKTTLIHNIDGHFGVTLRRI